MNETLYVFHIQIKDFSLPKSIKKTLHCFCWLHISQPNTVTVKIYFMNCFYVHFHSFTLDIYFSSMKIRMTVYGLSVWGGGGGGG